jgi:hypothetical protein
MVAGHQATGVFNLAPKPEGSFAEQLLHAEATNLQLGAGMGLVHALSPQLSAMERGLDLTLSSLNLPKPSDSLIPSLAFAEGKPLFTRTKDVKGSLHLWMSEVKGDPNEMRESGLPTVVPSLNPLEQRNIISLAIELGVVVPPSEILNALSADTQKAFRSRVMGLISKREVASRPLLLTSNLSASS